MIKDIDYYMKLNYRMELIYDNADDSYVLRFPELPGCMTSGYTAESALANADEAKKLWLEAAIEDCPDKITEPEENIFSIPFELHLPERVQKRITERAAEEGTSASQYCIEVLSQYA